MFLVCFFDNILITKETQSPTLQGLVGDWRSVEGHTGEA